MNKRLSIGIILITLILSTIIGFAKESVENIKVTYKNIKILLNNKIMKLEDEPFIHGGRVYLPIRAVAENMGSQVIWDSSNNTVHISTIKDIEETDPFKGERFIYGEIMGIDRNNRTIHIYQHIDDNSVEEDPYLQVADDVIIILQRNDKKINLDFEDIRIGDVAGIVVNPKGQVRGMIIGY